MAERKETQRESRTVLGAGLDTCSLTNILIIREIFLSFIDIFPRSDVVDARPRGSQTARIHRPWLSGEFSPALASIVMIQLIYSLILLVRSQLFFVSVGGDA